MKRALVVHYRQRQRGEFVVRAGQYPLRKGTAMRIDPKKLLVWLCLGVIAFVLYAYTIGLYPRYFDLTWDEEVQLHDGRVIVVRRKHTFERLHRELGPYTSAIARDTELSFDTGGSTGRVTQVFKGFDPMFLDQYQGVWYAITMGGAYNKSDEIPGQNWGLNWYDCNHVAALHGSKFKPISIHDLPAVFQRHNMLLLLGDVDEQASFDGKLVTLRDKADWSRRHPPGYGQEFICRAPKNAVRPQNIFEITRHQGETK